MGCGCGSRKTEIKSLNNLIKNVINDLPADNKGFKMENIETTGRNRTLFVASNSRPVLRPNTRTDFTDEYI
jgi:hypothetical protein